MRRIIIVILFFISLLINSLTAQQLPSDRHPDWFQIAKEHRFVQPINKVSVLDFGALGDGVHDDSEAIMQAMASFNGSCGAVTFPAGRYRITQSIALLDSLVLEGESTSGSQLLFDPGNQSMTGITMAREQAEAFVQVVWIGAFGDNRLVCEQGGQFNVGDFIEIRQQNGDWDVVPADWAIFSVGQITEIEAILGDTLYLKSPFRIQPDTSLNLEARKIFPRVNAGLRCLTLKRLNTLPEDAGSNVFLHYAAHCRITGIKSDSSSGSHIALNASSNILIQGCYLHDAFVYDGSGTRGYGITLSMHSNECLIVNSVFRHLRHSMMTKTGSNGNIFAYNYSLEPYRSELIHDFSGDISLHGHFSYANLFEGNIVQNIITDHYWGPSGPWNTFFRNRAELYGIIMTNSNLQETNDQNYLGNEVVGSPFPYGQYILTGENQFQYSNNVGGLILPPGTDILNDESYFLENRPSFWEDEMPWPSIGYPNEVGSGLIPAKNRFQLNDELMVCDDDDLVKMEDFSGLSERIRVSPQPAHDWVQFEVSSVSQWVKFRLFNLNGQEIIKMEAISLTKGRPIRLYRPANLKPGMYVAVLSKHGGDQNRVKVIFD